MEILVFPGSDFTTAPRFAREKSMSRYSSAATFFIPCPLTLARLPSGYDANDVGLPIRVHHHEQVPLVAQTQGDESQLARGIRILTGQSEVVLENRDCLSETHLVGPKVRLRLRRIPLEPHCDSV